MKKEKIMIILIIVLIILWLLFCLKYSIILGMIDTSGYSNLQIILFATIVIALPFIAIFIFLKGMSLDSGKLYRRFLA